MIRFIARNISRFVTLILLQYFFNLIPFSGLDISPFFYITFILLLPFETPGWLLLISAFFLGLGVDWNTDSLGQHALASVFIAGLRPMVLAFIAERDEYDQGTYPRMAYFGFSWALRYALILSFAHSLVFYTVEAFTFVDFHLVLFKTVINTLFTSLLIMLSQYWVFKKVA